MAEDDELMAMLLPEPRLYSNQIPTPLFAWSVALAQIERYYFEIERSHFGLSPSYCPGSVSMLIDYWNSSCSPKGNAIATAFDAYVIQDDKCLSFNLFSPDYSMARVKSWGIDSSIGQVEDSFFLMFFYVHPNKPELMFSVNGVQLFDFDPELNATYWLHSWRQLLAFKTRFPREYDHLQNSVTPFYQKYFREANFIDDNLAWLVQKHKTQAWLRTLLFLQINYCGACGDRHLRKNDPNYCDRCKSLVDQWQSVQQDHPF